MQVCLHIHFSNLTIQRDLIIKDSKGVKYMKKQRVTENLKQYE